MADKTLPEYACKESLHFGAVAHPLVVEAVKRVFVPCERVHAAGIVGRNYDGPALYGVSLRQVYAGVIAGGALPERMGRGGVFALYPGGHPLVFRGAARYALRLCEEQNHIITAEREGFFHRHGVSQRAVVIQPALHGVIGNAFARLKEKADLPDVVFHSLRHSSTTYKLKINHGDIKATQGDTGHAGPEMVTKVYAHILDEDRKINAQKFEAAFYSNPDMRQIEAQSAQKSLPPATADLGDLIRQLQEQPGLASTLAQLLNGAVQGTTG